MSAEKNLTPLSEQDYESIAEAVMETARGRWFLAEYAKRNRQSDTQTILTALKKLEAAVLPAMQPVAIASAPAPSPALVEPAPGIDPARLRDELDAILRDTAAVLPGLTGDAVSPAGALRLVDDLSEAAQSLRLSATGLSAIGDSLADSEEERRARIVLGRQALAIQAMASVQDEAAGEVQTLLDAFRQTLKRIAGLAAALDHLAGGSKQMPLQPESDLAIAAAALPSILTEPEPEMPPSTAMVSELGWQPDPSLDTSLDALPLRERLALFT